VVRVARQYAAGYASARTASSLVRGVVTGPGDHGLQIVPIFWSRNKKPTRAELARLDPLPDLLRLGLGTAAYWAGQSDGRIRVHPSVLPWTRVEVPHGCDENELLDLAMNSWRRQPPSDPFQHVMVYIPRTGACPWAGLGVVGGNVTWINGTLGPKVGAHEIGHNFGLGHARSAVCTSGAARVPPSGSCSLSEYGDLPDVMGGGFGNLNTALADYLGLADVVPVDPGRTRRVTLAPISRISARRALKVSVPGGYVYLDYRPAQGLDSPAAWGGVQAHYLPSTLQPYSELLDLQAETGGPLARVALPGLMVWQIPGAAVAVRLESAGPTSATLVVEPTAFDRSAAPGADPSTPMAGHRYPPTVPIRWVPPAAVAGVVSQDLLLDGRLSRRLPATTGAATLAGVAVGRHRVQVVGTDRAGNRGYGRTVEFDVDRALTDPPPQLREPRPGAISNDSVSVAWDLVGAGRTARLLLDGVPVRAGLRTSRQTLLGVADGPHVLVVQAMSGARVVTSSDAVPVIVDALAPTAPADLVWRSGRLGWTRAAHGGSGLAHYRLVVDGGPPRVVPGVLGSAPVPLADGRHTLSLTAEDRVGNVSVPVTLDVLADTSPPGRAAIVTPLGGAVEPGPTVTVTFTVPLDPHSEVSELWVSVNGRRVPQAPTDLGDGTASVQVPLGRGSNVLRASALNGTGLRSDSAPVKVTVP
jgi:hypothetical protein